ncbi:hypothetical protein [Nitrosospira sp. NpAV]|uniref:hypothetical protein n=1 Tax=Nitrosospira sp. NpAV TaxID=58133 RepID=UPI0005A1BF97|nr:hypothetical protein [Nitrosospira sp. NpAV]KIO50240.1 hypothetical protein SQ11_00565 [Nitrosospira sp. NpAV]
MSASLEDEKKALLDRMHASRDAYRSRFSHMEEEDVPADALHVFPRSHTFKFLTRHPYSAALGLVAVLAIMPRGSLRRATRTGAAVTAGLLGGKAKTLMIRQVLPSVVHLLRSHNQRSRTRFP